MTAKDNTKGQETDRVSESSSDQSQPADRLRSESHDSGLGSQRNQESTNHSNSMQQSGLVGNLTIDNGSSQSSSEKVIGTGSQNSFEQTANAASSKTPASSDEKDSPKASNEGSLQSQSGNFCHKASQDNLGDKSKERAGVGHDNQGGNDKAADPSDRKDDKNSDRGGAPDKQRGTNPQSVLNDPKASPEDKLRAANEMAASGQKGFRGEDGRKYSIHQQKYGDRSATVVSTTDSHGRFMPVLRGMVDKQGNVSHQKYANGRDASYEGDRARRNLNDSNVLGASHSDSAHEHKHSLNKHHNSEKHNNSEKKHEKDRPEDREHEKTENRNHNETGGKDNREKTWNFLRNELHLTKAQAAGVMGNLEHESHFNPDQHQLGGGPGYGLAQWEGSRKRDLQSFAHKEHSSPKSLDTQLKFMKHELMTTERSAFSALKQAKTPEQAALAFSKKYERAGRPNMSARYKYARQAFSRYGSQEDD